MWYKLNWIYVWNQKVRPEPEPPFTPWANTLAYYPLQKDVNDYSWNWRNWTNYNVTFSDGIATFNGSYSSIVVPSADRQKPTSNFTISAWARPTSWTHTGSWKPMFIVTKWQFYANTEQDFFYWLAITDENKYAFWWIATWISDDWDTYPWESTTAVNLNERNLYTLTNNWTTKTLYLNGVQIKQATADTTDSSSSIPIVIGDAYFNNNHGYFNWNISEVILENKTRTQQDILDYYNQTKGIYGL